MKPFHTIAVPHKDILEGRLAMDIFAADLWETYLKRAPSEYKDAEQFFAKTYLTAGLKNLLGVVEKRLKGEGGDPVIQIQTPFGGGKTHALIALYHHAKHWNVKPVVIVGTALNPQEETLWGILEKQVKGGNKLLTGNISPGREAIRALLEKSQPLLILMDEILEYMAKAAGVQVTETSLAAQTLAFMQELTEVAGTLEKVCVVITLPSSFLEHYDERAEKLFQQLQKVSGRVERIYTPVQENEISKIVRRRLFSSINEPAMKVEVSEFLDYAEKEGILPVDKEISEYRDRFLESYPFIPDVIDVLYHQWGSYPTFQRTRGVLRLLSLVIYSMKQSGRPYITLSDFDLTNDEVRRELIKHIGSEFDSVVAADITGFGSGSKKIDSSLGKSFRGLLLGTRSSTCVFLYSFSGGQEKGAHIGEIKRSATTTENPSSVVVEAIEQLKGKLFYLQSQNDKYFFLNQPNMNRILLTKMENIKEKDLFETENNILRQHISGSQLKVFLWPEKPKDIPDTEELKLVITAESDEVFMKKVLESKGESPRVYRNTMFFISPSEVEKNSLLNLIKRKTAYEQIQVDKSIRLTDEQKHEVASNLQKEEESLRDAVKRCYRLAFVPSRDGLKEIDLGIPTYGERKSLDQGVYEQLKAEQEILDRISPLVVKEKYLKDKDFVEVRKIYDSMLRTPGERRVTSVEALEESIVQGVKQGLFGIGDLTEDGNSVKCRYFKEDAHVDLSESEVILKDSICSMQKQLGAQTPILSPVSSKSSVKSETLPSTPTLSAGARYVDHIDLEFEVPRGKISQLMGMMNFLQSRFQHLRITIKATDGSITEDEYLNKIKETLKQLDIDFQDKT